mgnify:CR=1 FL=1
MDIASLSIAQSTINVASDVQVAVLSKSLDTMETLGDGMKKMMESSVTPYLGQNIDYLVFSYIFPFSFSFQWIYPRNKKLTG